MIEKDFLNQLQYLIEKACPSPLVFCTKPLGYDSFITVCDRLSEMNTIKIWLPIVQEVIPK
tara:strand:+ start:588 stop:770 length:183 start_codon:yes stop_codon:yes gene_type:complete